MKDLSKGKILQLKEELKLADQENFLLKEILSSSTEPILITDAKPKIIYVNKAWENLTGYKFGEVQGKNPNINKSSKTPPEVNINIKRLYKKCGTYTTEEIINKRKNGSLYQVYCTFYSIAKNIKPMFCIQIMHDITKRKSIEFLKNEILASTAHELKTPVTVMKLLTELHLRKRFKKKPDKIKTSDLVLMNRELDKLNRLVNDILESVRNETGKMKLHFSTFDILKVSKEIVKEVKPLYPKRKFTINNQSNASISADKDRIEQVITNLIINAAKYSKEKSPIAINVTSSDCEVVFSIKDLGIGIPTPKRPFVFDKFYKGEVSKPGFGIGLYVAQQIIKMHKGKIWFETEESKGSTFYFTLPK